MSDTFVPLPRPSAASKDGGFNPIKIISQSAAPAHGDSCREPVLTLQRDGDKIIGIRIECVCGQVINLSCEY
jgi:hypothetical protein